LIISLNPIHLFESEKPPSCYTIFRASKIKQAFVKGSALVFKSSEEDKLWKISFSKTVKLTKLITMVEIPNSISLKTHRRLKILYDSL